MEFTLTLELALLLFAVALVAGVLDTLAGGGGLLTVPALLLAGLPPLTALGTNKFQAIFGTGTATYMMLKKRLVSPKECLPLMLYAFLGSVIGTVIVQFINLEHLKVIIPIVLALICIYFIVDPQASNEKDGEAHQAKLSQKHYRLGPITGIGVYDGMFGPGTGTFFALAGVACRAQSLLSSTAFAKTLNFSTNFASFLVFCALGQIIFLAGATMVAGQLIGARIGANLLVSINRNSLRWLIVIACLTMLAKYCWDNFIV